MKALINSRSLLTISTFMLILIERDDGNKKQTLEN